MVLYVFRNKPSKSAVAVAVALRGLGINAKKVSRLPRRGTHSYVNWGTANVAGLNAVPTYGKYTENQKLVAAGVPTVLASLTPPAEQDAEWVWRTFSHHGGLDLLDQPTARAQPGFWVYREEIAKEYRIHVFQGVSVRAGRKEPLDPATSHPWIRSYDGGWRINYDGRGVKDKHREVAKAATAALGLDFAAVDVAERADGTVFVLEVNRAPGAEGQTAVRYAERIKAWYEGN